MLTSHRKLVAATVATAAVAACGIAAAAGTYRTATAATAAQDRAAVRCTAPGRKPITVVLVHGAWADSSSWDGEINELERDGCAVRAADNPVENLTTDARTVADFVRTIPGPVLLVGHSYGGMVITNAAAEAHNVIGLVYVDAYAPAPGQAAIQLNGKTSAFGIHPLSQLLATVPGAPKGTENLLLQRSTVLKYFANDLPPMQALEVWASQTETSTAALKTPSRYAAWRRLPSWYFIASGDQIISPQAQLAMARRAHSHVTIFHGGSHVALMSHPAAVTAVIGKALSSLLAAGA